MRQALKRNPNRVRTAHSHPIPAPTGGWDAISPLASMKPDRAIVLDNWIPRNGYVEGRSGFTEHGTGLGSGVVETILPYHGVSAATSKLFAAANNIIYDVTVAGAGSSSDTGYTSNRFQFVNFSTSAGKFLWVCNGANAPRHWNGSAWATPSLTLSTVTTFTSADIIHVGAHQNRLWLTFKDSTIAGYLPVSSVAGTVTNFDLGGFFTKGGHLVGVGTWTRDAGAGMDDFAVFLSSKGQIAVYAGTNPADSSDWLLVGVYDIGEPIGRRSFTKVGGDLAIVTVDGVLPMSLALQQDRGAVDKVAITGRIKNAMNAAAQSYGTHFGWELTPFAEKTVALLNVPVTEGSLQHQYVIETLTGGWARFTGWNMNCFGVYRGELYGGGNDGKVYKMFNGGLDGTTDIDLIGQTAYNYMPQRGLEKQWTQIRPLVTTDSNSELALALSTDFKDNGSLGTPPVSDVEAALYDLAVWDEDIYPVEDRTIAFWGTLGGFGRCASIHFRAISGATDEVVLRVNAFDAAYKVGGLM